MGMLDKETLNSAVPAVDKPVTFASDSDIDAVLSGMNEEKQPFDKQPEAEEEIQVLEEEKEVSPLQKRRSNQTAQFIVETIDRTLASGLAIWAKSDNSKDFEADPEDIDELAEYWGVYFAGKDIDLPPWVMATVVTVIVLSKKFNHASIIRKKNLQLAEEQKLNKDLREEIDTLKKERELNKLKKEVESLKNEVK